MGALCSNFMAKEWQFPGRIPQLTMAEGSKDHRRGRWACLCDPLWPGHSRPGGPLA